MRIISTLSRSWPAYGLVVKIGRNEIPDGDATRRALIEYLFTPFIEARQFVVEPEPAAAAKGGQ
jgi:hypothetical protein